jgi:hypothetical protein
MFHWPRTAGYYAAVGLAVAFEVVAASSSPTAS